MTGPGFEDEVSALLAEYRETAVQWDGLQNLEAMKRKGNAKRANTVFRANHALYKRLRMNEAGRMGIAQLMSDPLIGVRLLAATDSLAWMPEGAIAVLEDIHRNQDSGLHAVTAKYTLLAHRGGTLDLDW